MKKRHNKVFFLSRHWKDDHPVLLRWKDYYESRGVVFYAINVSWNIYYPDRKRKIKELLKLRLMMLRMRCCLIHANDLDSGMLAMWMNRIFLIPFIFDAHEVFSCEYPQSIESEFYKQHKSFAEKSIMPMAKMVIVPNKQRIELFKSMYEEVLGVNYVLVENKSLGAATAKSEFDIQSQFPECRTVYYGGTFWMGRKQESFPELAEVFKENGMQLVLSGEHNEYLEAIIKNKSVFYAGNIPVNAFLDFAKQMDIALAWYYPTTINDELCAPLKIFDYLAIGKPILAPRLPYIIELSERFPGVIHLFEPGNWIDCFEKAKVISDSYEEFAKIAACNSFVGYSWEGQYSNMDVVFKREGINLCAE